MATEIEELSQLRFIDSGAIRDLICVFNISGAMQGRRKVGVESVVSLPGGEVILYQQ